MTTANHAQVSPFPKSRFDVLAGYTRQPTYLTDALKRIVSGWTKSHQLHQLLAWNWKAERERVERAAASIPTGPRSMVSIGGTQFIPLERAG